MTTRSSLLSQSKVLVLVLGVLALPFAAGCAGDATDSEETEETGSALASENKNDKTAFEFFVKKGLSKVQAAGVVGNLDQESNMNPEVHQYDDGPGRGIAQWSEGGRWNDSYHDNVVWYADEHHESPWALETQLNFIWFELTEHGYGYSELKNAKTIDEATLAFMDRFEECGDCVASNRIAHAEAAYHDFGK